jgi:beta-N-acetylhexosaminidase
LVAEQAFRAIQSAVRNGRISEVCIDESVRRILTAKARLGLMKPFVFTVFGSPFVLTHVPELTSYIATYDISRTAELAAIKAVTGKIEFKGRLPVNLPGLYPIGHGLKAPVAAAEK